MLTPNRLNPFKPPFLTDYVLENQPQAFPRYPDLPSRITQDMESKDIIRLQRDLTTNALSLMGEGDKQRYDGLSEGYRRWEKSIVNTFNSIGLNHLERFFKHPNVKQIGKTNVALWRNAFCLSDRRLIHNVVLGTITAEAALAADDDSHNGVLLIAYWELAARGTRSRELKGTHSRELTHTPYKRLRTRPCGGSAASRSAPTRDAKSSNASPSQLHTTMEEHNSKQKKNMTRPGSRAAKKKKARPKWCMDLFGRVVGGSPKSGGTMNLRV